MITVARHWALVWIGLTAFLSYAAGIYTQPPEDP